MGKKHLWMNQRGDSKRTAIQRKTKPKECESIKLRSDIKKIKIPRRAQMLNPEPLHRSLYD